MTTPGPQSALPFPLAPHARGDDAARVPAVPRQEPLPEGPGAVRVRDAFELLAGLPDESIDLVITDPPYSSIELHRSRGTTTRLTSDWFHTIPDERLPELLAQVARVLRQDRHFYLFCDEVTADVIKQQQRLSADRQPNGARRCACGLVYWKELVWAKTTLDGEKIRGGTGYHYRAANERILFFEKGKRALNDLGIPDVLLAPRPQIRGPAVKPGDLVRTLVEQSSAPGELVLDPFCGSGVVGREARAVGRRFLLGDIDLAYLDPSLRPFAPEGHAAPAALTDAALAPPPLEQLVSGDALDDELEAARALGWLAPGGAGPALLALLEVRPTERRAAVRRALREGGGAADPPRLRAWRAWALHAKGA